MGAPADTPREDLALQLGKLAIERKLVSPEQLKAALAEQARDLATGQKQPRPLGNILVAKGFITSGQLVALLDEQKLAAGISREAKAPAYPPFGKYSILRVLGQGGMGVVYEAIDSELKRRVALKTMLANPNADPQEAKLDEERFLREARLSAGLAKHAGIVSVYEAGIIEGKRYLAMEFIDGLPMSKWRKAGSVTIRQQVALLRDVALAVHHAHQAHVIHRDLKPDNVLVDHGGRPHVADFGLAKSVGQNVSMSLSASGMVMGTPTHMSPEQARGLKSIDHRTDIYSLGVMLYETLTGRLPFEGETAIEILMKAVNKPAPAPSTVIKPGSNPTLDKAVENICLKCLAKRPGDRYASADLLAADLTRWLKGEDVRAQAPRTQRKVVGGKKPNALIYAVGGMIAVIVIALAILMPSRQSPVDPNVAADAAAMARLEEQKKAKEERDRLNRELEGVKAEAAKAKREREEMAKREREATSEVDRQRIALERQKMEERERVAEEETKRKVAELEAVRVPAPAAAPPSSPALPSEDAWKQAVNLMQFIDPMKDAIAGTWKLQDGKLVSDGGTSFSRIEMPYHPGSEYDFRVMFTPHGNTGDVHQLLTASGRPFEWLMGGWNNTIFGFQSIAGAAAFANPTTTRASLQQGRQHTSLIQLRNTGIWAYLDGRLMATWGTNYTDMELPASWKLRDNTVLGLGTMGGATTFARVEVLEVTGKGRLGRPSNAVDPKPVTPPSAGLGLVGHWKLDDGKGTTVTDSSGRGLAGAIEGASTWGIGKSGGGLAFAGASSSVKVADSPDLRIVGDMTLAFWMKVDAVASDWVRLVGKGTGTVRNYGVWLEAPPSGRILFQQENVPGSLSVNSTTVIEPGKWYHLACTLQGNTGYVFINGILETSGARSKPPLTSADPLTFGYGGMHSPFRGTLDDVRIYNRALSAREITVLWKEARQPLPDPKKAAEAEKAIKDSFKAEFSKRSVEDVDALAQKLLKRAAGMDDDLAMRYVLLREARDLAAQAGHGAIALQAIDEIETTYSVDAFDLARTALATSSKAAKTADALTRLTNNYLAVVEKAVGTDNFDEATAFLPRADAAARASQDAGLIARIQVRRKELEETKREFAKAKSAQKMLEAKSDDAEANFALGKFLCFFKNDWSQGLPRLAKGADVAIRGAAEHDLASPPDVSGRVALADLWWELAEKQPERIKSRMRDRALSWYQLAWPQVAGEVKDKLRGRFKAAPSRPGARGPVAGPIPGWLPSEGGCTVDDTMSHSGLGSLRLHSADGNGYGVNSAGIPAKPGDQFIVSGWFMTDRNGPPGLNPFSLDFLRADGSLFGGDGPGLPIDQPYWFALQKRITCPPGTTGVRVSIWVFGKGGTMWADEISVKRIGEDKELLMFGGFEQR